MVMRQGMSPYRKEKKKKNDYGCTLSINSERLPAPFWTAFSPLWTAFPPLWTAFPSLWTASSPLDCFFSSQPLVPSLA